MSVIFANESFLVEESPLEVLYVYDRHPLFHNGKKYHMTILNPVHQHKGEWEESAYNFGEFKKELMRGLSRVRDLEYSVASTYLKEQMESKFPKAQIKYDLNTTGPHYTLLQEAKRKFKMASSKEENLRSGLIKLAYENPEMREDLLPLITSSMEKSKSFGKMEEPPSVMEKEIRERKPVRQD